MPLACFEVVKVVCRGYFNRACAEFWVDQNCVAYDWDLIAKDRVLDGFTDEVLVAFVIRVNRDSLVT